MSLEQLMEKGLTKEQATAVLALHKTAIDGNYVPKTTFEAEREQVKVLKSQVTERDTQIATLGAFKGTAEDLQKKVTELEGKNREASEKYAAELAAMQLTTAVKFEVASQVHDPDDVISKLDMKLITVRDGKVIAGLTEQVDKLRTDKPHYFKAASTTPPAQGAAPAGLPAGWNIQGGTPKEGSGLPEPGSKAAEAAKFGAELAKAKVASAGYAAKAEQIYFK